MEDIYVGQCFDPEAVGRLTEELRRLLFPACFGNGGQGAQEVFRDTAALIGEEKTEVFFHSLPGIRDVLATDLQAALDGDPAAGSREEVLLAYPGFYAVTVYRLAHALYEAGVALLPRMMTEHSHSRTGIDIHPGARIGSHFFIDHGTGVVIGQTAVIGEGVKLYQGVTLGALSTRNAAKRGEGKRHPTVEDGVTVYANATILGGDTVIGRGSTIGANVFITRSVAPGTRVSTDAPPLRFRYL